MLVISLSPFSPKYFLLIISPKVAQRQKDSASFPAKQRPPEPIIMWYWHVQVMLVPICTYTLHRCSPINISFASCFAFLSTFSNSLLLLLRCSDCSFQKPVWCVTTHKNGGWGDGLWLLYPDDMDSHGEPTKKTIQGCPILHRLQYSKTTSARSLRCNFPRPVDLRWLAATRLATL